MPKPSELPNISPPKLNNMFNPQNDGLDISDSDVNNTGNASKKGKKKKKKKANNIPRPGDGIDTFK